MAKSFCMGVDKGKEFVKSQGAEAIFVTKDSKVYLTDGLKGNFKLNDKSFTLED